MSNRDKTGTIFQKRDIIASRGNMKIYRDIVLKNGTVPGKPGRLVTLAVGLVQLVADDGRDVSEFNLVRWYRCLGRSIIIHLQSH